MDFTSIVTRLNELTTFMNNVVSLSKKIFQLPSSTVGNKLVAVWNESSEQTEQFNLTSAIQDMYTLTDGIKELGTVSNVGNDYTFSVGYKWRINGVNYENEETVLNVPDASTGFYRIDIAVVDETNSIYIVSGVESSTLAVQPENPPNTLILCVFQIFEGVISNSDPIITQQNNIPLKVNILSSDLSADTVAGFVDYFNDLNPNLLVKETTSIVQFLCTDTNNIYQLTGVGKGLYGLSNLQITTNNVLKFSITGGTPTLPQVLTAGDRETVVLSDGADHTLVLADATKYLVQSEPFNVVLNASVFPLNTEIYLYNASGGNILVSGSANIISTNVIRDNSLALIKKIIDDDTWVLVRIESNPYTPAEIGLGNVDNTSDLDKPISDATQTAIDNLTASVTSQFQGYKIKETVKVLASSNITLSGTQTIDGYGVSVGDRVIANGQTTQTQNGCYVVSSGAWTRAADSDTATELDKALYFVLLGAENGGKIFYQSNAVPGIGTGIALWLPFLTNPTATEVDALKRDGSNANSNVNLGGYNLDANELTSANRINGNGYYLNKVGGKLGLYVTGTDAIIAILDSDSGDNIYTYANGNLTYNANTNELKWGSDILAKISDIPSLSGYATTSALSSGLATKQDVLTASNTHTFVDGLTAMTTPVDADKMLIVDNSVSLSKKITWANIKATLLTYFQGIFAPKSDFMALTTAYVLASSTSLQKMFNVGSGSAGAFNTTINKTYEFRIEFDMTGLSSSAGTLGFGFLGTAVITSISYKAETSKQVLATAASPFISSIQTASQSTITSSTTGTSAKGVITGIVRCTTAGTLIPAISTSIGIGTAQVEVNSYFKITEIGANTITATSNIS